MNKFPSSDNNNNNKLTLTLHKQSGMTLIEIMVAMLLGVFLIAGLLQFFLGSRQTYRLSDGQSRLQENGRFALELLSHDIRLAGYIGCSTVSTTNPVIVANNPLVAPVAHAGIVAVVAASTITGGNDNAGSFTSPTPALSATLNTDVIQGTDAITVQFGESCGGYTTATKNDVADPTGIIPATHTCGTITPGTGTTYSTIGTPLVIADCNTSHVFRASAGTSQNKDADAAGTATSALGKSYAAGSEILLFRSYTYFIRMSASGNQPALWRFDNNKPASGSTNPEELIEGIENMQLTYGIDTDADGSANQYIAAPTAAQWPNAVSVRVVLTARSIENNLMSANNAVRSFNGDNAFVDRRLLKNFTATIDLRNR